ncbi:hypothetical protein FB459_1092 [Yimella lutea]|uniref:Uncharacterized protein n=1 Tax=Yimella lutea TaxID=587872 RepID=A0A542EEJ0_9MICO|nr:hypothetical protein FB459_1092 [Yimella lutea]
MSRFEHASGFGACPFVPQAPGSTSEKVRLTRPRWLSHTPDEGGRMRRNHGEMRW